MLWDFDFYDDVSLCYVAAEIKVSSPVWVVGCLDFCVVCPRLFNDFKFIPRRFHISKNCTAFEEHTWCKISSESSRACLCVVRLLESTVQTLRYRT